MSSGKERKKEKVRRAGRCDKCQEKSGSDTSVSSNPLNLYLLFNQGGVLSSFSPFY